MWRWIRENDDIWRPIDFALMGKEYGWELVYWKRCQERIVVNAKLRVIKEDYSVCREKQREQQQFQVWLLQIQLDW